MWINEIKDGSSVSGIYLIKECAKCVSNAGVPYLNMVLQDKTGIIDAKKWEIKDPDLEIIDKLGFVNIFGEALDYKGKVQIKILKMSLVPEEEVQLEDFLIQSPIPTEKLIKDFNFYKDSIQDPDCKEILDWVMNKYYKKYIDYPAAVKNHHEFLHGLLHHSVSMCKIAEVCAINYNDVNRDLLITGCLLHDVGKVLELSGPVSTKYTTEGMLLGHLAIGSMIIAAANRELKLKSETPLLLEHMLLSHHGKLEYGAAVLPKTREALLLSLIDDMDSKMMFLDKAYDGVEKGEFTDKIFVLDGRAFYKGK